MQTRTLAIIGAILLAVALVFGTLSVALAQTTPFGWGPGGMMGAYGPMHGPAAGGYGPGGMMGGPGRGGMMGGAFQSGTGPLTSLVDAQKAFQAYVDRTGNADLALDEVMEFERNYYAIVKERSTKSGAFELLADKQTGSVFPEYGPTMMWNTKYGHMGATGRGMMGGLTGPAMNAQPTVTAEQARQLAQQWLNASQPGSSTEAPDAFPGYYTLHLVRNGQVTGMLSVNAYTGQVWYHNWHGAFGQERDLGS